MEALVVGIDKRSNLKLMFLKYSFPNQFIEETIKKGIKGAEKVNIHENKKASKLVLNILYKTIMKKTATIVFMRKKSLTKCVC